MNKVLLTGRLTDDVKLGGKGDKQYANFTLAVRDGVDEEGNNRAQFIRCVVFGKGAEVLDRFTGKGDPLSICGRLNNSKYEDEEGETRWATSVIVEDFDLIGSRRSGEESDTKPVKKNGKYHK